MRFCGWWMDTGITIIYLQLDTYNTIQIFIGNIQFGVAASWRYTTKMTTPRKILITDNNTWIYVEYKYGCNICNNCDYPCTILGGLIFGSATYVIVRTMGTFTTQCIYYVVFGVVLVG